MSDKLASMMNEQVQMEAEAEAYYANLWGWCQCKGLKGLAHFFKHKMKDEFCDKKWWIDFIHDAGFEYDQKVVKAFNKPAGKDEVGVIKGLFKQCISTEEKVAKHINEIYVEALAVKNALVCKNLKPSMKSQFFEIEEMKTLSEKANRMSTGGDLNAFDESI